MFIALYNIFNKQYSQQPWKSDWGQNITTPFHILDQNILKLKHGSTFLKYKKERGWRDIMAVILLGAVGKNITLISIMSL